MFERYRFGHPTPDDFFAVANEVAGRDLSIETPDGEADCYFVHPKSGAHPGVLMWPDAFGLRPALRKMADRLAASGYAVLVVNPYYRDHRGPVLPPDSSPAWAG